MRLSEPVRGERRAGLRDNGWGYRPLKAINAGLVKRAAVPGSKTKTKAAVLHVHRANEEHC